MSERSALHDREVGLLGQKHASYLAKLPAVRALPTVSNYSKDARFNCHSVVRYAELFSPSPEAYTP